MTDRAWPSVVTINGVVATLATTEAMVHLAGLREPQKQLTYRADHGGVRINLDPNPAFPYCARWGYMELDQSRPTERRRWCWATALTCAQRRPRSSPISSSGASVAHLSCAEVIPRAVHSRRSRPEATAEAGWFDFPNR
jgi:hypothetical protein